MTKRLIILTCIILISACQTIPSKALKWTENSMALRQLQTKRFETKDEKKILIAAAGVLQDMGYSIEESETGLGVLVGSKTRDATNAGQVVAALFIALLGGGNSPLDKEQQIRASLVTRPVKKGHINLRVTFQRVVWNTQGTVSRAESIEDEKTYQEFFDKLSKSVFLEAHAI
ncbi:MAG: hypothetical protein GY804_10730 [Alphaproteobacteria bacterium]|nr:hypothetical protein [Alphaproteobacteria bacterium]